MADLIERQELLNLIDHYIKHEGDAKKKHSALFIKGMEDGYFRIRSHVLQMPSAQPQKCSDILDELKDDDYYNYIHTGHSRFSEDDWDYLILNAKEKEKLHERLDK